MKDVLDEEPPVLPLRGIFGLGLIGIAAIAIGYNAMVAQSGQHPAPLGDGWGTRATSNGQPKAQGLKPRQQSSLPSSAVSKTPMGRDGGDARIKALQEQLAVLGYYKASVDGQAGEGTRAAVIAYQQARGLEATGRVSAELFEQISADALFMAASGLEAGDAGAAPSAVPATIRQAASAAPSPERERMKLIQQGLAELGYRPGPADGIVGEQTRQAIRQFQKDRGLPQTGNLDTAALKELGKVTGITSLHGV